MAARKKRIMRPLAAGGTRGATVARNYVGALGGGRTDRVTRPGGARGRRVIKTGGVRITGMYRPNQDGGRAARGAAAKRGGRGLNATQGFSMRAGRLVTGMRVRTRRISVASRQG